MLRCGLVCGGAVRTHSVCEAKDDALTVGDDSGGGAGKEWKNRAQLCRFLALVAVGLGRLPRGALEDFAEVELVGKAQGVGDLFDGEGGELEEALCFQEQAVEDQAFGGTTGDILQEAEEACGGDGEGVGVELDVVMGGVVLFEQGDEGVIERVAGGVFDFAIGGGQTVEPLDFEEEGVQQVAQGGGAAKGAGLEVFCGQKVAQGIEGGGLGGGHVEAVLAAHRAQDEVARGLRLAGVEEKVVGEAEEVGGEGVCCKEVVHLAFDDDGKGAWGQGGDDAVDAVAAHAGLHPEDFLEVVAVGPIVGGVKGLGAHVLHEEARGGVVDEAVDLDGGRSGVWTHGIDSAPCVAIVAEGRPAS